MSELIIREPKISDAEAFISAMQRSQNLHSLWVKSPQTKEEFEKYLQRSQLANQKSFLACDVSGNIVGVFNINEIVYNRCHAFLSSGLTQSNPINFQSGSSGSKPICLI